MGTSFADNLYVDVRSALDTRRARPIKFILERVWPFAAVFASQVALTRGYARDEAALLAARMGESDAARDLLSRYEVKNSLLGGCVAAARIGGEEYALHHIRTLQLIDRARRHVNLEGVRSMFEIGGGFGAFVHLLLDNFASLRKVVYLDVVPNLYVGTCYLRTLFGHAVRDFSETAPLGRIAFRDDDTREILAITPWQIEQLDLSIDLFWNANSFVEMPREVVSNYARHVLRLGQSDRVDDCAGYLRRRRAGHPSAGGAARRVLGPPVRARSIPHARPSLRRSSRSRARRAVGDISVRQFGPVW